MFIIDDVFKSIFETVSKEVKEKYDIEYSIEEIYNVFNCQIETTKLAISKGISIHWTRFGKFVFTRRGERHSEYNKYVKEISSDDYGLSVDEIEKLKKDFIIKKAIERKELISNSVKVKDGNELTVKEFLETKQVNPIKVNIFKPLNK